MHKSKTNHPQAPACSNSAIYLAIFISPKCIADLLHWLIKIMLHLSSQVCNSGWICCLSLGYNRGHRFSVLQLWKHSTLKHKQFSRMPVSFRQNAISTSMFVRWFRSINWLFLWRFEPKTKWNKFFGNLWKKNNVHSTRTNEVIIWMKDSCYLSGGEGRG